MVQIFSAIARYTSIIFICIYMILAFQAIRSIPKEKKRKYFYWQMAIISYIYLMHIELIYLKTNVMSVFIWGLAVYIFMYMIMAVYNKLYPRSNKFLLNNIWLMLSIGFIILIRISYSRGIRQFVMGAITFVVTLVVPYIISKVKKFRQFSYAYAVIGIFLLGLVFIIGNVTYGAKLSLDFGFISVQPSEFVKITYPIFIAGILYQNVSVKNILMSALFAGMHIIILVLSKDLGTALIFALTFLFIVYAASGKKVILIGGLLGGSAAAVMGYLLFSHVQTRVAAWIDPWSIIDTKGYQISQSIFAIGTGSLFGMGLYEGNPSYIPVVEQDFIFSAISEEMGGFFAIALILLCFHTFVIMLNIALKCKDAFYKLTCFGMAVIYGIQVFLTIGGAIKLIPSTGVTLPLISYGGSSLVSTLIMFSIIQGFNIYDSIQDSVTGEMETTATE